MRTYKNVIFNNNFTLSIFINKKKAGAYTPAFYQYIFVIYSTVTDLAKFRG